MDIEARDEGGGGTNATSQQSSKLIRVKIVRVLAFWFYCMIAGIVITLVSVLAGRDETLVATFFIGVLFQKIFSWALQ